MIKYHWYELIYRFYYWLLSYIISILIIWYYKINILFSIININLIYTSLTEAFEEYIYFCLLIALLFNLPLLFIHYIYYIIPGLYLFEFKQFIKNTLKYSIFFIIFYYLLFYWLFDNILNFFINFETNYLNLNLKLKDFIKFFNKYILMFLILFILPSINFKLNNKRKFIYILLLILISFITPPDLLSLLIFILPIIILIEINYFIKLLNKNYKG